jgi:DNA primase
MSANPIRVMKEKRLSFAEAKQIAITEYLSKLGVEPVKKRNHDWWYLSPLRKERTASFKVDTKLNVWYDHGQGEGGTILDLGAKLEKCTVDEFRIALSSDSYSGLSLHQQPVKDGKPLTKVEVLLIRPLSDKKLLNYLKSRGVEAETAQKYCKEVHFKIGSSTYNAIGFPNRSGGLELRNNWFKGATSPKDLTIIDSQQNKIAVFEGFMDFLSFVEINNRKIAPAGDSGFIVLNSVAFAPRALDILVPSSNEVTLYLDNDLAGTLAKQKLSQGGLNYRDGSCLYIGYKDLNEYLVSSLKANSKGLQKRSKGHKT